MQRNFTHLNHHYFLLLFLFSLIFISCVYFNTFYNAETSFKKALEIIEESPIIDDDELPSQAKKLLGEAIKNSKLILKEYPEKKIIPKPTVMKTFCTEHTISGMYCPVNGKLVYCTKTIERCTEKNVTPPVRVPSFSIADQKILFFYNFPELVEMRDFIRSAIATSEYCDNESVWIDG